MIFKYFLELSINTSALFILVLLIRLIMRSNTNKSITYYLWVICFIGLMLPRLDFKVMTVPKIISSEIIDSFVRYVRKIVLSINNSWKLSGFISLLWIFFIAIVVVYLIFDYVKVKNKIKFSILKYENIYESEVIKSPFIYGLLKPKIYLPAGNEDFENIIKHEQYHIKRKDYLIKLFCLFVLLVNIYNPIVWIGYYYFIKDMELSCDYEITKSFSYDEKVSYVNLLLSFAGKINNSVISFSESNIEERIKNIMGNKKSGYLIGGLALIIILVSLLFKPINDLILKKCKIDNENNITCVDGAKVLPSNVTYIYPLANPTISCGWGCFEGHEGVDITDKNNKSADVMAVADGVVEKIGFDAEFGAYITIKHDNGIQSLYAAIDIKLKIGDKVKQGNIIGNLTKNAYKSTGPHVHFLFIDKDGNKITDSEKMLEYILKTPIE